MPSENLIVLKWRFLNLLPFKLIKQTFFKTTDKYRALMNRIGLEKDEKQM